MRTASAVFWLEESLIWLLESRTIPTSARWCAQNKEKATRSRPEDSSKKRLGCTECALGFGEAFSWHADRRCCVVFVGFNLYPHKWEASSWDALLPVGRLIQMVILFGTARTEVSQRWNSKYPHCSSVLLPLFPLMQNESQARKYKHWSRDWRVIYCCGMGQHVVLAQPTVTVLRAEYCQGSPRRCLLTKLGKMQGFHQMQMTMNNMYDSMYPLCFQCAEGGIADLLKWCFSNHIVMIVKVFTLEYNIWTHSR